MDRTKSPTYTFYVFIYLFLIKKRRCASQHKTKDLTLMPLYRNFKEPASFPLEMENALLLYMFIE